MRVGSEQIPPLSKLKRVCKDLQFVTQGKPDVFLLPFWSNKNQAFLSIAFGVEIAPMFWLGIMEEEPLEFLASIYTVVRILYWSHFKFLFPSSTPQQN